MKRNFFTADLHLGHSNVCEFSERPFASVKEHDDAIIAGINEVVDRRDVLWVIGDFSLSNHKDVGKYRRRIECREVHLIQGNHDRRNSTHFSTVFDLREVKADGERFFLCHYPILSWAKQKHGAIHLYGHCHGVVEGWLDEKMPGRRSLDVGVDVAAKRLGAYRPFSVQEILRLVGMGYDIRRCN